MATYVKLKMSFDFLSKIEIFRFFDFQKLIFNRIINRGPCCYNWCWKQHIITVAGFQQNCCFSATNVDFSAFSFFIHAKIRKMMKKQHLCLKNNNFIVFQQNWCFVASVNIYSAMGIVGLITYFLSIFDANFAKNFKLFLKFCSWGW